MLTPARLSQITVEIVFVLLGGLIVFLGASGRVFFDRRGVPWLVLSVALLAWGLVGLARPGEWWARWQKWNRGVSLVLLGALMLLMTRVPFLYVPKLLIGVGLVLALRGILGAQLILRQR